MHGFSFVILPSSCCLCFDSKWFLVGIRVVSCSSCLLGILRGAKHHNGSKYDISQKLRVCCEFLPCMPKSRRTYWCDSSGIHSKYFDRSPKCRCEFIRNDFCCCHSDRLPTFCPSLLEGRHRIWETVIAKGRLILIRIDSIWLNIIYVISYNPF